MRVKAEEAKGECYEEFTRHACFIKFTVLATATATAIMLWTAGTRKIRGFAGLFHNDISRDLPWPCNCGHGRLAVHNNMDYHDFQGFRHINGLPANQWPNQGVKQPFLA